LNGCGNGIYCIGVGHRLHPHGRITTNGDLVITPSNYRLA